MLLIMKPDKALRAFFVNKSDDTDKVGTSLDDIKISKTN